MQEKMNPFLNFITSGKYYEIRDESNIDMVVRYILQNFLILLGGSLLFGFAFSNYKIGNNAEAIVDFVMGMTTVVAFFILRTQASFRIPSFMTVVPFGVLCAFFFYGGGTALSGIFWSFTFPMMAVFLLGRLWGIILSIALWVFMCCSALIPNFSPVHFELAYASRILSVYVLISALTLVYEHTKITKDRWVEVLTKSLKEERDTITAMKDNLRVGLFLMDRDFIIQGQYSKALEDVLVDHELEGKSFVEFLSSSLKEKEIETLRDYFDMVLNQSYDAQMLEDINPIHEFRFVHPVTREEKTLTTLFSALERDNGELFLLASISDITREAALKEQLVEEETKRRAEMESMFEVIHVEPKVLLDFIEDADYEFNTINRLLKDRSKSSQEVVVEIYQSIHAIKSNAVILGLQSFAQKLHVFEERIKLLRDREEDVQFEDILQITFALENLMKTEDSFKEIIEKISNFGSEHEKVGESFVLIELLKKASEKTALSENKMVRFEASDIDPLLISGKYRRNLKEILLQLVRNSVVHGIEQPDYRMDIGKEKEGLIRLQTEKRGDSLLVLLSDNGSGIDFAQISKNAIANKLIPESLSKNKKALTNLLFSPGFSTASKTDHNAGRGVGLHLVKERLKEIGGTLKLKSENGKGTLFVISIPLS